jgi:1,4-dihydroxy-2-naphthoate octaprenyltransferase
MAISVQAGANLTNTYYDFVNGVDSKNIEGGELTLVEKRVTESGVLSLSIFFYTLGFLCILPNLLVLQSLQLYSIFFGGVALAFAYTATPIGLKYKCLGDITIFLCFGPLLMQGTALFLTGQTNVLLHIYSLPVGLITENILHVNNIRDIKADSNAGVTTLAIALGFEKSYALYVFFFMLSYITTLYISVFYHWGCVAALLTLPMTSHLCSLCSTSNSGKLLTLPEETAKLHAIFGILLLLGIILTDKGILTIA